MEDYKAMETLHYFILAAEREGSRRFYEKLKALDITVSQAEVLRVLQDCPPLTLKALGEKLICEHGSPSRLVDRLYKHSLVSKVQDEMDGRAVLITLTPEGLEKAQKIVYIEREIYQRLADTIPGHFVEELNTLLSASLIRLPIGNVLRNRGFIPYDKDKK